jgi:hypothetical protein
LARLRPALFDGSRPVRSSSSRRRGVALDVLSLAAVASPADRAVARREFTRLVDTT